MTKELNIGDYVRTKDGIERLKKENDYGWFFEKGMIIKPDNLEKYIIKSSPNIIDLIEVGDLVKIKNEGWVQVSIKFEVLKFFDNSGTEYLYEEIEAIITKEQIVSMEYKIGDKE